MYFTAATLTALLAAAAPVAAQASAQTIVAGIDGLTTQSSDLNTLVQSVSITNVFSTGPQVVDGYRKFIDSTQQTVTQLSGSPSKQRRAAFRAKTRRQDALSGDPSKVVSDLGEIVEDPGELLGDKTKRQEEGSAGVVEVLEGVGEDVQVKRQAPTFSPEDQQALCSSFTTFVQGHRELTQSLIGKHGVFSLTPFVAPLAAVLRANEGSLDTFAFSLIDVVPTCAQGMTDNKNSLDNVVTQAVDLYSG